MKRDPICAKVLATRLIPNVSPDLAAKLELRPDQKSLALHRSRRGDQEG